MKKKILFSTILPLLALGMAISGAKTVESVNAETGAVNLWSENFAGQAEGTAFGNYAVTTMNGIKWAKDSNGSVGVDIPASTHSGDFSFSYLASYPTVDGYNYVEFRDAGGSGVNVEFSLHSAGNAFYTSIKVGGSEKARSWADEACHYASGFYGTNEYNSIRFVKKGTYVGIYINGTRTSIYDLGTAGTTTSIYFADYNLPNSYYTNYVYENWNDVSWTFPDFYETFENYANGVNYRCNADSFTMENGMLKSINPSAGNINYLALMNNSANTIIDFDLKVDSLESASKYFYVIIGESGSTNYFEYTIEMKSDGAWFLCKYNGNVVYHSGNHGTNPEISTSAINHVEIALTSNVVSFYFNGKLCGTVNGLISVFSYVSFNTWCCGTTIGVDNIKMTQVDYAGAANTYVSSFMSTLATECAALDVKSTTWTSLKTAYAGLSKEVKDYIYYHASNDASGSYKEMKDRYSFIVGKYSYEAFIKNSLDVALSAPVMEVNRVSLFNSGNNKTWILITVAVVALASLSLFVLLKKKSNKYN